MAGQAGREQMVAAGPFLRTAWRARQRAASIVTAARRFFADEGFVEVETPALQISPGLEPHLEASRPNCATRTRWARRRYLHTSPEFAMKKLLAGGEPSIWQLAPVFRDGERGRRTTRIRDARMVPRRAFMAGPTSPIATARWRGASQIISGNLQRNVTARPCLRGGDEGTAGRDLAGRAAGNLPQRRRGVRHRHYRLDIFATAPDPARPDLRLLAVAAERIGIGRTPATTGNRSISASFSTASSRISASARRPSLRLSGIDGGAIRRKPGRSASSRAVRALCLRSRTRQRFWELTDPANNAPVSVPTRPASRQLYGETYPIDEDFLLRSNRLARMRRYRPRFRPPGHAVTGADTSKRCCGRRSSDVCLPGYFVGC